MDDATARSARLRARAKALLDGARAHPTIAGTRPKRAPRAMTTRVPVDHAPRRDAWKKSQG